MHYPRGVVSQGEDMSKVLAPAHREVELCMQYI